MSARILAIAPIDKRATRAALQDLFCEEIGTLEDLRAFGGSREDKDHLKAALADYREAKRALKYASDFKILEKMRSLGLDYLIVRGTNG